ncbi:MAG: glutaredoxin domain-containing protein [Betaproteobacteria bacterium]
MNPAPLRVYWRPGCSSCVKVKEFLSGLGVEYESVNVSAEPEAMKELAELGVRAIPVVTRGKEYVFAQALEDVSRFVGRELHVKRLPPAELVRKWLNVLEAAQRHALQIPPARLETRATAGRDRSVRSLAYHVYQIPDAFLRAVEDGVEDLSAIYNELPPGHIRTGADIAAYGASVTKRLAAWWDNLADKSARRTVSTYYGERALHELLERCAWHSAQHARQVIVVLEESGVKVDRPLTAEDYAGLPMPEGLWE